MAALLRVPPAEAVERLSALLEERRGLERQVSELQRRLATGGGAAAIEQVGGIAFAGRNLGEVSPRELKGLAEEIGRSTEAGVVALVSTAEGKGSVVAWVSPELAGRLDAVALVREASAAMGGKGGGGRRELAQAGGPDGARAGRGARCHPRGAGAGRLRHNPSASDRPDMDPGADDPVRPLSDTLQPANLAWRPCRQDAAGAPIACTTPSPITG